MATIFHVSRRQLSNWRCLWCSIRRSSIWGLFPQFVWDYLRDVPTVWDETRCLAGYPGRDAVLARRKGDLWYVAGINGEQYGKTFDLTLPASGRAVLIRDKAGERNAVEQIPVEIPGDRRISLPVDGWGGFVLVIR